MIDTPEIVYYYCKPHTFENIIHNHIMWLCYMKKMNDNGEIDYVLGEKRPIKRSNRVDIIYCQHG